MKKVFRKYFAPFFVAFAVCVPVVFAAGEKAEQAPKNGVVREVWRNIRGVNVEDLTKNPAFAKAPSEKTIVANIDDEGLGTEIGCRYTALLEVPETGEYTFYIASDDGSELWLGKDATQNDMSCIAFVKGYTFRHNWTSQVNQKSAPVKLEKGRKYYMYVLLKQNLSADHVAVAWTGPSIKEPCVIPASAYSQPSQPGK